jgi:hypothetical protein
LFFIHPFYFIEKLPFLATVVGSIYGEEEILNWIKETLVTRETK